MFPCSISQSMKYRFIKYLWIQKAMEQPRIERLFRLMGLMLSNRKYTVVELGEKVGLNKRSIYRHIQSFRDAGFGVVRNGQYYSLARDKGFIKEIGQMISLTTEEANIFYRMLARLEERSPMKVSLIRKLENNYSCETMADMTDDTNQGRNINNLCDAIRKRHKVLLKGYKSGAGTTGDRVIEPFAFMNSYIGVWGYDTEQHTIRAFRIKRIDDVVDLEQPWENAGIHKKGYEDVFRSAGSLRKRIRLGLGSKACNLLLEEYPLSERYLTQVSDDRWVLDIEVASYRGACRFVLGLLDDIEILDSPDFEDYIYDFLLTNLNLDRLMKCEVHKPLR